MMFKEHKNKTTSRELKAVIDRQKRPKGGAKRVGKKTQKIKTSKKNNRIDIIIFVFK